ncbi:unnamed protein product [Strongylus vulgaris]|uniref:Sulfotransferase domain-containing protein n=1 Tax=Strongylus vulgaris TaxID=40348 RepID=A0A3P7K9U5_STRVU|nr:unnamed protein product [Strongylus vulgaris]
MIQAGYFQHLKLDEAEMPSCDRTPPRTPKTPCSPLELHNNTFCFRKGPDTPVIYQPEGHPRQAVIDGDIWPPIFKPQHVRRLTTVRKHAIYCGFDVVKFADMLSVELTDLTDLSRYDINPPDDESLFRSAKNMLVEDDDVFIATYPKCGTTWLQHICHQLIRGENYQATEGNEMCVQSPMIERMGAKFLSNIERPRILKTHFSAYNIPKNNHAKYIFCVRNPKDCCTSYFHHNRNFKIYNFANGDWETFVDLFLSGQLAFGDYFDHLLGWLPFIDQPNVLFLMYEDMLKDLEGTIYKIGMFLGGDAEKLVQNSERLETVVQNSGIEAMKKDQKRWFPEAIL